MLLDELMGRACATHGAPGLTVSLHLRHHGPVPLRTPLRILARVSDTDNRKTHVSGSITTEADPATSTHPELVTSQAERLDENPLRRRVVIALRLLPVTMEMPYQPLPIDQSDVRYIHGPDSAQQSGVPAGETVEFEWRGSAVYPGTFRKFWVHVPAQYDPAQPASLMVFQDGWWYLDPAGEVRGAIVLDNLVHRGDIPVTIGVFVDPGVFPDGENPKNRNHEYDAFDDQYVTFLLTEIIPQVAERYTIARSPEGWGICGGSSGGNCAFTAAWLRPDKFRRVIGCLSSFAQMPDGNPYPDLIARVPRKPLRIFMQSGHRDLHWNEPQGNWLAENLRVAAALAEAGYDFRLVLGDGGHSPNHGGVLLPDALRWLWRPDED